LKTGISFGNTRYNVWIGNPYVIYTRWFHKKISVSWKVDGQYKIGKLIQVIDFSDISFSLNYRIIDSLGIFLSGKISLNRANKKFNGKFIPMAYQTRLGTYEAILGLQYQYKNLFLALG
jgi:hypothetical protein